MLTNRKTPQRAGKVQLIDARRFFVKMPKSLGNKRNKLGDPNDRPSEPDQIGDITRIFGNFQDSETHTFPEEDPITKELVERKRIVSKVFDNEDFGFHKIVVERPLRLNFQASLERIARLESEPAFVKLAISSKKDEAVRRREIEAGKQRQKEIRQLLADFAAAHGETLYKQRAAFVDDLRWRERVAGILLSASERKTVLAALGEREATGLSPLPDPKKYESWSSYTEKNMDGKRIDKVDLAISSIPSMTIKLMQGRFDWKEQMKQIVERIDSWNGDSTST